MNFRLCVVGHESSIQEIKDVIRAKFQNIDVHTVPFNSDDEAARAHVELEKALPHCHGTLYTRRDPWKIMSSRMEHRLPTRYVDIGASNLVHSLLEASYRLHVDILRPSVDSLGHDAVMNAYRSVGIPEEAVTAHLVQVDVGSEHFVHKVWEAHRTNYRNGLCAFCATNVRSVLDRLAEEGIPCVLLAPNTETYIYEIRRLMVSHGLRKIATNQMVMVALALYPRHDYSIGEQTVLQEVLDRNKAEEHIALFAQRVNGALISQIRATSYIICNSAELEELTEQYSRIDLLESIPMRTTYVLGMGIGYGENIKEAKTHAEIGLRQADATRGSQAYVVYSATNTVGPIEPNEMVAPSSELFEQRIVQAAEAAGLSITTVQRIDRFARQKRGKVVTSSALARELGVSHRTANRTVAKLEQCGYVAEVGRHVVDKRGRPSRMLKVLI